MPLPIPCNRSVFRGVPLTAVVAASLFWLAGCSDSKVESPASPSVESAESAMPATMATSELPVLVNQPFTEARFHELNRGEGLVLVDVSATWCPTCRQQKQVLAKFQQQHPDVTLIVLNVDFDEQKEWVTHFKAPRQSTLALYRGGEQVWFAVAEQREEVIFEALLKAAGRSA